MRLSTLLFAMLTVIAVHAQTVPVMETGGQVMPNEWIDKDTGHKVIKLTRREGLNASFYFHNNPFVGNEMLFCGGKMNFAGNDNLHGSGPKEGLQLYAVNLKTLAIRQLTNEPWLNHLQFSPTDPHLLMFCHEGPWHEVLSSALTSKDTRISMQ